MTDIDDDYPIYGISSKVSRDNDYPEIVHCRVEAIQTLNEILEPNHPSTGISFAL